MEQQFLANLLLCRFRQGRDLGDSFFKYLDHKEQYTTPASLRLIRLQAVRALRKTDIALTRCAGLKLITLRISASSVSSLDVFDNRAWLPRRGMCRALARE